MPIPASSRTIRRPGSGAIWVIQIAPGRPDHAAASNCRTAQPRAAQSSSRFRPAPPRPALRVGARLSGRLVVDEKPQDGVGLGDPGNHAAAALIIAGKADDLTQGARLAQEAIESGKARETLENLVTLSREGESEASQNGN